MKCPTFLVHRTRAAHVPEIGRLRYNPTRFWLGKPKTFPKSAENHLSRDRGLTVHKKSIDFHPKSHVFPNLGFHLSLEIGTLDTLDFRNAVVLQ